MPLKSGGAVDNEYTRGRANCGLISMGKKPCPAAGVEQFSDGGFEECDLAAWTTTKTGGTWGCVTQGIVHHPISCQVLPSEGSYMARFDNIAGTEIVTGTIEQDFSEPIPVSCFGDTSIFTVDTSHSGDGCPPDAPDVWQIEVLYTDGTSTVLDISGESPCGMTTHDLKAILEAGKTVKGVKFTVTLDEFNNKEVFIDACTLKI